MDYDVITLFPAYYEVQFTKTTYQNAGYMDDPFYEVTIYFPAFHKWNVYVKTIYPETLSG